MESKQSVNPTPPRARLSNPWQSRLRGWLGTMPWENVWQTISSCKLLATNVRFSQWRIKWSETAATSPDNSVFKAAMVCALGEEEALRYLVPCSSLRGPSGLPLPHHPWHSPTLCTHTGNIHIRGDGTLMGDNRFIAAKNVLWVLALNQEPF